MTNIPTHPIDVCIYHSPCTDGFAAAWVCWRYAQQQGCTPTFLPGDYSKLSAQEQFWLAAVRGKHVLCVDFSFPRAQTEWLRATAASFTVVDHHATAARDLAGLPACHFSCDEHSGAVGTWHFLFPQLPVPPILAYVEDQDLWRHCLPVSWEVCAALNSHPREFGEWNYLEDLFATSHGFDRLVKEGKALRRQEDQLLADILTNEEIWILDGYQVPAVNTAVLCSRAAGQLAEHATLGVGACYHLAAEQITFSLRRRGSSTVDVGALAHRWPGGGGHPGAAGFCVPLSQVDFVRRQVFSPAAPLAPTPRPWWQRLWRT